MVIKLDDFSFGNFHFNSLGEIDINTLEPNQVLKSNPADLQLRSGSTKRTRTRSIVPVLDSSIISVQDLKFVKR